MENKTYNFMNEVHVETDNMGTFNKQWQSIGFSNYPTNDNHIKEGRYFSFDEAKELYAQGLTSENLVEVNGKLRLQCSHLSAITAFTVVNGVALNASEKNQNLIDYAKKIGLVHDNPIPIEMHVGTKTLEINGDDYIFRYKINKDKIVEGFRVEFLEKICVGAIKRTANKFCNYHHDGIVEKQYDFQCKSVSFSLSDLELEVVTTKRFATEKSFIHALRVLDMQLFIMLNKDEHDMIFFDAVINMVRDMGQNHWINEEWGEESDKKSNKYWFDKPLPDYQKI